MTNQPTLSPTRPVATTVRIGTRGSELALWQARAVQRDLQTTFPDLSTELVVIRPEGDRDKQSSLLAIGGRGVFASALQEELLAGNVDLAVHCTKDVPTISPVGLGLAAFPAREDPRDALISRHGVALRDLPSNPIIGTSSRRRAVQVTNLRPDAVIVDLRGNIDTRLRKSETVDYDAVILASAGLTRMGWQDRITEYLSIDTFVPAPGQGALVIEARVSPDPAWQIAAALDRPDVALSVELERHFLRTMGGGCTTPVGAHIVVSGDSVQIWAMMARDDGTRLQQVTQQFSLASAHEDVTRLSMEMRRDLGTVWVSGVDDHIGATDAPSRSSLTGRTVLVTGTDAFVERSSVAFGESGAAVVPAPTTVIRPTSTPGVLAAALRDAAAGGFAWLVVTSQQTVPVLAAFSAEQIAGKAKIAVVGESTAAAMAEIGLAPDLVPAVQTGPGLAEELLARIQPGEKVLCLFGSRASGEITSALRLADIPTVRVETYRSTGELANAEAVHEAVRGGRVEIVSFASPLAVNVLTRELGADLAALSGACLVAIGTTTACAMTEAGLPVHTVAETPTPAGLVAVCETYFNQERDS